MNLCDRAIWLHRGALVMDDAARLVAETYLQSLAEEAYGEAGGDAIVESIRARTRAQQMCGPAPFLERIPSPGLLFVARVTSEREVGGVAIEPVREAPLHQLQIELGGIVTDDWLLAMTNSRREHALLVPSLCAAWLGENGPGRHRATSLDL